MTHVKIHEPATGRVVAVDAKTWKTLVDNKNQGGMVFIEEIPEPQRGDVLLPYKTGGRELKSMQHVVAAEKVAEQSKEADFSGTVIVKKEVVEPPVEPKKEPEEPVQGMTKEEIHEQFTASQLKEILADNNIEFSKRPNKDELVNLYYKNQNKIK